LTIEQTWIPERALCIFAHPDDVDYAAAGTAALWAQGGCELTYLVLTDGNAGSHDPAMTPERLGQIRRSEQEAAAAIVGAKACIFLGYQDGLLEPTLGIRKEVVRWIRRVRPQAVVCGDPRSYFSGNTYINHPDHRAAARIAVEAVFPAAEMNLLYPDLLEDGLTGHKPNYVYIATWEDPDHFVDITDTIALKIEALRQHRSQMGDRDPEARIKERHAAIGRSAEYTYAEAFRLMTLRPIETGAS
jgi:LmbE family N-acetylglucosaminyl deacetylase